MSKMKHCQADPEDALLGSPPETDFTRYPACCRAAPIRGVRTAASPVGVAAGNPAQQDFLEELQGQVEDVAADVRKTRAEAVDLAQRVESGAMVQERRNEEVRETFQHIGVLLNTTATLSAKFEGLELAVREREEITALQHEHSEETAAALVERIADITKATQGLADDQKDAAHRTAEAKAEIAANKELFGQQVETLRADVDRAVAMADVLATLRTVLDEVRRDAATATGDAVQRHAALEGRLVALGDRITAVQQEGRDAVAAAVQRAEIAEERAEGAVAQVQELRLEMAKQTGDMNLRFEEMRRELTASVRDECARARDDAIATAETAARTVEDRCMSRVEQAASDTTAQAADLATRIDPRLEELHRRIDAVAAADDSMSRRLDEQQRFYDEQAATVAAALEGADSRVERAVSATTSAHELVAAAQRDTTQRIDALMHDHANAVQRAENSQQDVAHRIQMVEAALGKFEERGAAAAVAERCGQLAADLRTATHEGEQRHKRLVESTHQALERMAAANDSPATVATVRQELGHLRETVAAHQTALETAKYDGTAVTDLKEWVADLDRRAVSKAEVEHQQAAIASQVSTVKQQLTNVESLLGQRIEAERSAREYEASALRSQIQRVGTTSRVLGLSPSP